MVLLPLVVLGALVAGWIVTGRHRGRHGDSESRILSLSMQTEELADGLGRARRIDETDAEFLRRVSGADPAAHRLGAVVSQARFSASVPDDAVGPAERDAGRVQQVMTHSVSGPRRALAPHIGRAKRTLRRLRRRRSDRA